MKLPSEGYIVQGSVVQMPRCGEVVLTSSQALVVVDAATGKIAKVIDEGENEYERVQAYAKKKKVIRLTKEQVLMPGFVDAHAHAPQHAFIGNGLSLPLLDWLRTYTFPAESKFADVNHARKIYQAAVARHLKNGSTTVSYFGTIHVEGTLALVDICRKLGQRAHVGKVCMDANAPDYYIEKSAKQSALDTQLFVDTVLSDNKKTASNLVTPSVIPRFAPSCSEELLKLLGDISIQKKLPVHTHLSENKAECEWVAGLFPKAKFYGDVYARAGLLHNRAYFAHCCRCAPVEREALRVADAGVVTCPTSNFIVGRALCPVRTWLDEGVQVSVGTDAAGGWSTSLLVALRHVVVASRLLAEQENDLHKSITWREALYLATKGGAQVLGLDVGAIEEGKPFDALILDLGDSGPYEGDAPYDAVLPEDDLNTLFERFIWNGDDRNILHVFVDGKRVSGSAPQRSIIFQGRANPLFKSLFSGALLAVCTGALVVLAVSRRASS